MPESFGDRMSRVARNMDKRARKLAAMDGAYRSPDKAALITQRKDGEGFAVPSGERYRIVCCDCGLAHDFVFVSADGNPIGIAAQRAHPPVPVAATVASKSVEDCMRLADAWGRMAGDYEFDPYVAEDEWAALQAAIVAYGDAQRNAALEQAAQTIRDWCAGHCAQTKECTPQDNSCDFVAAWNDAIKLVEGLKE